MVVTIDIRCIYMTTGWISLAILNRLDSSPNGLEPTNLYKTIGNSYRERNQIDRALIDLFRSESVTTGTGQLPLPFYPSYEEWRNTLFKITKKGSETLKNYKFE